jgi:3-(methylthio)propanoyl-CoA dehydrogenase
LRAEILTPLAKAHATDIGCEVASIGIQIHGGMGFVEETGAAQHYRDARIAPIYEGTNGIQAADLVGRKLGMAGGGGIRSLLADIAAGSGGHAALRDLTATLGALTDWLESAPIADRLAGSYPYLTMVATATCGWLMQRQSAAATELRARGEGDAEFLDAKIASAAFYCDQIVPSVLGLSAAVMAGDAALPPLPAVA